MKWQDSKYKIEKSTIFLFISTADLYFWTLGVFIGSLTKMTTIASIVKTPNSHSNSQIHVTFSLSSEIVDDIS